MKKYLIIFLVLVISILGVSQIYAQGKQKVPLDFFMGKWRGQISGVIVIPDESHPDVVKKYPFHVELIGHPAKLAIGPVGGGATAWMKFEATWPNKFTLVDTSVAVLLAYGPEPILTICYPVSDPATITEMTYNTIFYCAGFTVKVKNENLLLLTSPGADESQWGDSYAKGELYRVDTKCTKKDKIPLNVIASTEFKYKTKIYPNGTSIEKIHDKIRIVTEDNCVELYIEDYFMITGADGTEIEILISKLLDGVISSEIYQGSIHVDIWKGSKHHTFFTKSAIVEAPGTDFTLKVENDGTTTLTVLDGEVEFSDIQKRKTVIVKKNQKSVVKPGGLPTEPVSIDPNWIPKWWK